MERRDALVVAVCGIVPARVKQLLDGANLAETRQLHEVLLDGQTRLGRRHVLHFVLVSAGLRSLGVGAGRGCGRHGGGGRRARARSEGGRAGGLEVRQRRSGIQRRYRQRHSIIRRECWCGGVGGTLRTAVTAIISSPDGAARGAAYPAPHALARRLHFCCSPPHETRHALFSVCC